MRCATPLKTQHFLPGGFLCGPYKLDLFNVFEGTFPAGVPLIFDFEYLSQKTSQRLWRFPDNDLHKRTPFLRSAAGTTAGNQKKCHQKQQRAYRKNSRYQDSCSQCHSKNAQYPVPASSEHNSHNLSSVQYIHEWLVMKQKQPPLTGGCLRLFLSWLHIPFPQRF